ncbi:MAG: alpha-galactosidase [Anaerolineaceae bacterium]|nr:MAG: alpha-galactosidase [Anaerolineaceae bacterium]
MSIVYMEKDKSFVLQAKEATYILRIRKDKYIEHVYYGNKIEKPVISQMVKDKGRASFNANPDDDGSFSLDTMRAEYPAYGNTDLRVPAYQVQLDNGTRITDLTYDSYEIVKGKDKLKGLPSLTGSEDQVETLYITLVDKLINLKVVLSYSVFKNENVIARSAHFINQGNSNLSILRALSIGIDFDHYDFDMLSLSGSWARERHVVRRGIVHGTQSIESRRGASGHSENPFIALMDKGADENVGEVYGFSLVYSGNFLASVEVDQYDTTRVVMGVNPFDFSWKLEPGEDFITPEVVMVYSNAGIGHMSRTYHRIYRNNLMKSKFKNMERPIVINNWEGTYFDFTEDKIKEIAKQASELGMEMMVLDDGWFGKRDSDNCSLGDWYVHKGKLPNGLHSLVETIKSYGMKFGLWFEPEMVSPDSDLYRAHPDWCLHVPNRHRSLARNQLILDYSREDVREAILKMLTDILSSADISYVKWDMNRNMSEVGSALLEKSRQQETAHRYMLGVYEVMDTITDRFPHVLFESCSGGGGRFDPGILYYMPQNWTSDDTDGVERLKIQHGTSIVYPSCAITAHVSDVPNHQTGRNASMDFRHHVAMSGNFGYELDVTKYNDDEKKYIKEQVALYKSIRKLIQFGDLYRLESPFDGNDSSLIYVSEDKREAVLFLYRVLGIPNTPLRRIKLMGLDPSYNYEIGDETIISGEQLINYGINAPDELLWGDYKSSMILLRAQ